MAEDEEVFEDLKPLNIRCLSSDCENGLHCFRQTQKMANGLWGMGGLGGLGGLCRSCGASLVDWSRVYQRDLTDANYTFTMLKYERIRHHFWHVELDIKAINHAKRKGITDLHAAAERRIRASVAASQPKYDGRQTPKAGNVLYYAQHATASCCRKCIAEWHGIPLGKALTDAEVNYLTNLVMLYVKDRLPSLSEFGEKVPPIRISTKFPYKGQGDEQ